MLLNGYSSFGDKEAEYKMCSRSVLGLGEAIVSGKVTPDNYIISKKDNRLINKEIRCQKTKLVKENFSKLSIIKYIF